MQAETGLGAAIDYAARNWPVFPWRVRGGRRYPLTEHALLDATVDPDVIWEWGRRWPDAVWAIATGAPSRIVGLDIDVRAEYNGFHTLQDELELYSVHPETPTAHTPRAGCHLLFRWPGHFVKTIAGKLGPGLDIRGDGGSLMLPPAPGRSWDRHLGLDTPVADMPAWMAIAEPEPIAQSSAPVPRTDGLSPYAEGALDSACRLIGSAAAGQQELTLNAEAFAIGTLAGAKGIPADFALRALKWAARNMSSHDAARPWRPAELDRKVERAFRDGMAHPREAVGG
jgi:hypothetical protein